MVFRRGTRLKRRRTKSAKAIAYRALKMAKRMKPEVFTREVDWTDFGGAGAALGSQAAGSICHITDPWYSISQGDGIFSRSGHKIEPVAEQVEFNVQMLDSTAARALLGSDIWVRIMLVQIHDYKESGALTLADMFADTGALDGNFETVFSNYKSKKVYNTNEGRERSFTVLANRKVKLFDHSGADRIQAFGRMQTKRIKPITYEDQNGTSVQNPVALIAFASNNAKTDYIRCHLRYRLKAYYTDV